MAKTYGQKERNKTLFFKITMGYYLYMSLQDSRNVKIVHTSLNRYKGI